MQEMLFDLVKETRQDVKELRKLVHDHMLLTEQKLNEAKQPATFLSILGNVIVKLGAAAGLLAAVKTFVVK